MDESIKLKLLAGLPFTIDNICTLKPLTLMEIAEIGYDKYNLFLSNLVADVSDFKIPNVDLSKYSYWDILINNLYHGGSKYKNIILEALKVFLFEEFYFNKEFLVFYKDDKIIDRDIFEKIRDILKLQNCIEKKNEIKMANSKAEEIRQKILKGRQQLNKKNNNIVTFEDLVSVLAANSIGLNIKTIWELTMYQFNNQFTRMQMIEDYDINIRQLLAGAKKEDIQLRHYVSPIVNKESL